MTAPRPPLLTEAEVINESMGHCDNASKLRVDDTSWGMKYAREIYEAEITKLLDRIAELEGWASHANRPPVPLPEKGGE